MRIHVLGSAAGGGYPQWNCNCPMCDGLRRGRISARARTQSSIVVSGNGTDWVLFNASPDILAQIRAFPELQPARALRDTAIRSIVLMDGQVDHTTGLLMLREGRVPLEIWCTAMVREDMTTGNPLFTILGHFCGVDHHEIAIPSAGAFTPRGADGLEFTAVPLTSKAAPYSPHRDNPHPGDNIGMRIRDTRTGATAFYAPGLGAIEPHVADELARADCVMVDGTFWTDDEMVTLGISTKRARDIGHLPQSGAGGMIDVLRALPAKRKVLIHINNTNPILDEDSPQRAELARHGIEVAFDGMDIAL
ncbi:MAG: pyrroloquinoline quinone biosynthesis protein PqqB [Burkholderiales bacterium]|jgi:pyrroloquinoline quinone biosynthesis protein B|nr:pyrroloquinoline quinone biosynthesis protein PqqB [Burkholderiales bacterium]